MQRATTPGELPGDLRDALAPMARAVDAMQSMTTREIALEACRVLDTLTALSVHMRCHEHALLGASAGPGPAAEACRALHDACVGLKRILRMAERSDGALLLPPVSILGSHDSAALAFTAK